VLVPEMRLSTHEARQALPEQVPMEDAVFNLGRLGWLVAALGDGSQLRPEVMEDRLHQTPRAHLFPEAENLMDELVRAGASASCWSGAGPTLLGIVMGHEKAERVRHAGELAMKTHGVEGTAMILEPDMAGLHVE
jgi:homoserine kinase